MLIKVDRSVGKILTNYDLLDYSLKKEQEITEEFASIRHWKITQLFMRRKLFYIIISSQLDGVYAKTKCTFCTVKIYINLTFLIL